MVQICIVLWLDSGMQFKRTCTKGCVKSPSLKGGGGGGGGALTGPVHVGGGD